MGAYIFIFEFDRTHKRRVLDPEINEVFQEALNCDSSLMIDEYLHIKRSWFKKTIETRYNVYHETPAHDGTAYQARYQASASGNVSTVTAYLHGIINGVNHRYVTQRPVAEFKCAKTNKPTLGKTYLIIQEVDGKYRYAPSLLHFSLNSSPEWPYNTVAFTENDPEEIVGALNREK